ncbi:MAG: ATP-binding cassette domain-containing protein, partial [Eubacteriales bacterium]
MSSILEVKDLKVSFRTSGGTVKAVRDISFNLERGKTLAIVGESGSGKSVTSKAILGILAGNSIVESGEIVYDGKDLLKISEEDMCKIRGNRISMIFQDPLSALNPIVKIGKQITEAMLLKNKGNRKAARREFNEMLSLLSRNMKSALGASESAKVDLLITTLDRFSIEALRLETLYNASYAAAEGLISDIEDMTFLCGKNQKIDVKGRLKEFAGKLKNVHNPYLTKNTDEKLNGFASKLRALAAAYHAPKTEGEPVLDDSVTSELHALKDLLERITAQTRPD